MTTSSRRATLRLLTALGAALPALTRGAQPAAKAPQPAGKGRFFSAADRRFISAAVDRLLPEDEWPSASQAGVVDYVDRQLASDYGRGARMYLQGPIQRGTPQQGYQLGLTPAQLYRRALDAVHTQTRTQPFERRDPQAQDEYLKDLEAGRLMLGEVPSAVFFETLLANTIEGYFADPIYGGNKDMAGWRMIGFPGAYAVFMQLVDKHGLAYNRPPISIASTGHEDTGHAMETARQRPQQVTQK